MLVGIVAAGISLHLAFGTKLQARAILGAVVMGLAISGMHYSAMYGTTIAPTGLAGAATSHVLDRNLLAIVVAIVAFVICATSMLLLMPNRPMRGGGRPRPGRRRRRRAAGNVPVRSPVRRRRLPRPHHEGVNGPARIPVQSNGSTILIDPASICAIRADGRYTHLQDGGREYFCNLSITELESRLDPERFFRVHRSHIVQIARVKSIRRKGDGAVVTVGDEGRGDSGQPQRPAQAEGSADDLRPPRHATTSDKSAVVVRAHRRRISCRAADVRAPAADPNSLDDLDFLPRGARTRRDAPRLSGRRRSMIPGRFTYHRPGSVSEAVNAVGEPGRGCAGRWPAATA